MTDRLHERAQRIHEKTLIRAWEYRQRNHSKGAWHRLRRLLVDADQAWIIDGRGAAALEAAGHSPHPVGREFFPPKRLFFVSERTLQSVSTRHQVPVRMSVEFLQAANIVLVPMDHS